MQYATGEYLSILDSDDFYDLDMLEKAYNKVKGTESDIVVFACDHYDNVKKSYYPNNYSIRKHLLPEKSPFAGFCWLVMGQAFQKKFCGKKQSEIPGAENNK